MIVRLAAALPPLLFGWGLSGCAPTPAPSPGQMPATVPLPTDSAGAETPPGTDIYLVGLTTRDGMPQIVGAPQNLSDRPGYDNQPAFTPNGSAVLYTSIREDGQADIFRHDLASATSMQVTRTPESEYSPTIIPGGEAISVVRVEPDSTQRLWRFDLDGSDPELILPDVAPVGYHAWADANTLALFVLGDPPTLQLADTRTGAVEIIARNIGRSLHKIPSRNAISFVEKVSEDEWWIRQLDMATREITPLVRTLPGSEDYAWTPDGSLLMGQGSMLYAWRPGDAEWTPVADLAGAGVRTITRLAVNPGGDRLALVAEER